MSLGELVWKYNLDEVKDTYYDTKDTLIIARDTNKSAKQYAVIAIDKLYLLKTTDIHAYEVLLTHNRTGDDDDRVYKLYFDTELYIKDDQIDEVNNIRTEFIKAVLSFFEDRFKSNLFGKEEYHQAIGKYDEIIDINASGITDKGYKLSYHTILPVYLSNYSLIYDLIAYIIKEIGLEFESRLPSNIKNRYIIDRAVYTKNPEKSRLFRLPYQTKITDTSRPLIPMKEAEYTDYLITYFKPHKNITKIELNDAKLVLKLPKSIEIIGNKARTILDLEGVIKSSSHTPITNERIRELLLKYGIDEIEGYINIIIESIVNTYEHRQSRITWLKIITKLKRIGELDYKNKDYFKHTALLWTANGYKKEYKHTKQKEQNDLEVKEAISNFERTWDSISFDKLEEERKKDLNKSLDYLRNYAVKSDKELLDKIAIQKAMIELYDFKIPNGITEVQSSKEIDLITNGAVELDFMPYVRQQTLTTPENIGRGKTKAFIKIINKYCKTHSCPETLKKIQDRYNKRLLKATTEEERNQIERNYKTDKQNCPKVSSLFMIFSNRVLFGEDMKAKINKNLAEQGLNPAYFYLDTIDNSKLFLDQYSGIICSFESLYKNKDIINRIIRTKNYFTFFDEIETLLCSLTGNTRSPNEIGTMTILKDLWSDATTNICGDAYLSKKSIEFIQGMNKITNRLETHTYLHSNNYNPYPKTFNICMATSMKKGVKGEYYRKAVDDLKDKLKEALKNPENRICILCEEVAMIHQFRALFIEIAKDPSFNFSMETNYIEHTGEQRNNQSVEEYQHSLRMFKDQNLFEPIRVWIYNTCIMNGVSVEKVYFNYCYAVLDNFGTTKGGTIKANDILNAIGRARKSNEWNIYIYNNPYNNIGNIILDRDIIKKSIILEEQTLLSTSKEIDELGFDGVIDKTNKSIAEFIKYNKSARYYYIEECETYKFYQYADDGSKKISSMYFKAEFKIDDFKKYKVLTNDTEISKILMNLKVNSKYEINLNLSYKKEIFIELARLKGNNINDLTKDIKETIKTKNTPCIYENITLISDDIIKDTTANKRIMNIIEDLVEDRYKDADADLEYYNLFFTKESNRKERQILNNLYDFITDNDSNNNFRPLYIRELIRVLRNADLKDNGDAEELEGQYPPNPNDLFNFELSTDFIIKEKIEEKTKEIINQYNKYNHKYRPPKKLISNINDILYPLGITYIEIDKKRDTKGNREYKYIYKLVSTLETEKDAKPDYKGVKYFIFNLINWSKAVL